MILLVLFVAALARAQGQERMQGQTPAPNDLPKRTPGKVRKKRPPVRTFVLVGAGDIASGKELQGARATAKLIEQIPGTVFAAGNLRCEKGNTADFKKCDDPARGRSK